MAMRSVSGEQSRSSFEGGFASRLQSLANSVPSGTLELQNHVEGDCVIFKIVPANPNSAVIQGEASTQGGITFTVGHASSGELSKAREDFFFEICNAVLTSRLTEQIVESVSGRILSARIVLLVKGKKLRLGGHQIFWWLFPGRFNKMFKYEPYY